jgi:hypothetical protein
MFPFSDHVHDQIWNSSIEKLEHLSFISLFPGQSSYQSPDITASQSTNVAIFGWTNQSPD